MSAPLTSLRHADLRLTFGVPVSTAVVVGAPVWRDALVGAGVSISATGAPDLCVAPTVGEALANGTGVEVVVVLSGRGRRALRRAGFHARRVLSWGPRSEPPVLIVPLGHRRAVRYALVEVLARPQRWRRARNRLLAIVAPVTGIPGRTVLVGQRHDAGPFPLRAGDGDGHDLGEWCLVLGRGDELQRAVFLVFDRDGAPNVATKVARVPGPAGSAAMVRDQDALALLARAAPAAARHAPAPLGASEVHGHAVSSESSARGRPLNEVLLAGREAPATALLDEIAAWVVDLGVESASPGVDAELARLGRDVVPRWRDAGASPALLDGLESVPGVLQHNDLGSWNVLTTRSEFTVVDWESTSASGLPLWDLVYLLTDALVLLDGPRAMPARMAATLTLLRGEHPQSARLFRWVDRALDQLALPRDAAGRIVTLAWLHHGLSHRHRADARRDSGTDVPDHGSPPARAGTIPRLAVAWMRDPALGPSWEAFRQRR